MRRLIGLLFFVWIVFCCSDRGYAYSSLGMLFNEYVQAIRTFKEAIYVLIDSERACRTQEASIWQIGVEGGQGESFEGTFTPPLALCSWTYAVNNMVETITMYVLMPGLFLVIMWSFITFGIRIYKGQAFTLDFWAKRLFVLWLTALLLFPVQTIFSDIDDYRPLALWLAFNSVRAGMELAGKISEESLGETYFQLEELNDEAAEQLSIIFPTESDVSDWEAGIRIFLALPATVMVYLIDTRKKIDEVDNQMEELIKENPEIEQSLKKAEKEKSSWLTKVGLGTLGVLLGIGGALLGSLKLLLLGGGAFLSTSLDPGTQRHISEQVVEMIRLAMAEHIFGIVMGASFYIGLVFLLLRMLVYGAVVPLQVFLFPLGKWGSSKIISYFSNVLAFMLTPLVFVIFWYAGLIIRAIYLMIVHKVIFLFIEYVTWGSALQLFISIIASLVLPSMIIMPLAYLFIRTPGVLANFIGHTFQLGVSHFSQIKAPLAR